MPAVSTSRIEARFRELEERRAKGLVVYLTAGDPTLDATGGLLVVDLTPEEAEAYVSAMRAHKLDTVFLASPTSTNKRLERVAKLSSGFLYLISRTGVTGERSEISSTLRPLVERARRFTSL